MRATKLAAFAVLLCATQLAYAGGPRFVTGPPFFTAPAGQPIGWKQPQLLYYTDPGALSTSVDHQASDALVAAAAGVWNVPVASITVAQGGALAEHVSGQNVYLDTSGLIFPTDVMNSNAAAIPVAVVYDTDGSVTDLLLGSGASQPSGCRQNAVTETVDSFDPAGYILHAIVIVNGRCTGAEPELQLELQYQLMRAFGRVLGIGVVADQRQCLHRHSHPHWRTGRELAHHASAGHHLRPVRVPVPAQPVPTSPRRHRLHGRGVSRGRTRSRTLTA